jgi:hypothetical protein
MYRRHLGNEDLWNDCPYPDHDDAVRFGSSARVYNYLREQFRIVFDMVLTNYQVYDEGSDVYELYVATQLSESGDQNTGNVRNPRVS